MSDKVASSAPWRLRKFYLRVNINIWIFIVWVVNSCSVFVVVVVVKVVLVVVVNSLDNLYIFFVSEQATKKMCDKIARSANISF